MNSTFPSENPKNTSIFWHCVKNFFSKLPPSFIPMTHNTSLTTRLAQCLLAFTFLATGLSAPGTANAQALFVCADGSRVQDPIQCPKVRNVVVISPAGTYLTVMTNEMIKMYESMPGFTLILGNDIGTGNTGIFGAAPGTNRVAIGDQTGAAAAGGGTRWHAWTAYSSSNVGSSFQPLQFNGTAKTFLGGVDYTFSSSMLLGVAVSDERIRVATPFNGGSVSGNGNTIAPYFSWRFNTNWAADFSAGFGSTNINVVDNGGASVTGANKADRASYTAALGYGKVIDKWRFSAKGTLMSMESKLSSFTFSNGTFVAGTTSRNSQARLGGEAMYNAGMFLPFVGVTYIYDLERPFVTASGQNAANDRDAWQVRMGLIIKSAGSLYGSVQLSSELGRSQTKNEQILFNVGLRF